MAKPYLPGGNPIDSPEKFDPPMARIPEPIEGPTIGDIKEPTTQPDAVPEVTEEQKENVRAARKRAKNVTTMSEASDSISPLIIVGGVVALLWWWS